MNVKLSSSDWDLIIDSLDFFKSKSFTTEVMSGMLDMMIPTEKLDTKDKLQLEMRKQSDKEKREKEQAELNKKIDLLKAKILIAREEGKLD